MGILRNFIDYDLNKSKERAIMTSGIFIPLMVKIKHSIVDIFSQIIAVFMRTPTFAKTKCDPAVVG